MKTFLCIPVGPQRQQCAVFRQAGVRSNHSHKKFTILLNRQNIDVMALSHIQLPNGFSDPALRDGYFKNRVVVSQSNVVRDIV